jgi:hypothetical protein
MHLLCAPARLALFATTIAPKAARKKFHFDNEISLGTARSGNATTAKN